MSSDTTALDFAGTLREQRTNDVPARRVRADRPQPEQRVVETLPPERSLSATGQTFIAQVEQCQQERDQYRHERDQALARIEQFQITVNDRDSQIKTLRLELEQSRATIDAEREERVRLGVVVEDAIQSLQNARTKKIAEVAADPVDEPFTMEDETRG